MSHKIQKRTLNERKVSCISPEQTNPFTHNETQIKTDTQQLEHFPECLTHCCFWLEPLNERLSHSLIIASQITFHQQQSNTTKNSSLIYYLIVSFFMQLLVKFDSMSACLLLFWTHQIINYVVWVCVESTKLN